MGFRLRFRRTDAVAGTGEWQRRPMLSAGLRVAVFLGPILASLGIATLLSRTLPKATDGLTAALWIAVVAAGSLLTLFVLERAARKLLPLAALLNVSLLFPDRAPKRFAVARQTGSPRDLQARLQQARASGRSDDAQGMQGVVELVLALSVHDKGTRGHSERVRVFTDLIADELKIDEAGKARLRWAALLHDVGKLEVPTTILNKPDQPDAAEWQVLHRHPEEGARLVASLLPWLGEWGHAVVQHHERWDGTGYPHGLKGGQISLAARIVSVADTYEVMTAPRPYKRAMSVAAARRELTRAAGTQLDPHVVRAFLNISVGRLWRTIGFAAWIGQIPALSRLLDGLIRIGSTAGSGAATVATAGLIAVGSIATPVFSPNIHTHAAGRTNTPATSGLAQDGSGAAAGQSAPGGGGNSSSPAPDPSAAGNGGGASAAPTRGATSPPTTAPTPATNPTPTVPTTPTASPTPAPTPDPWSCAACTNTSNGCIHYCNNNNATTCVSFCQGNNNVACISHCFGSNNKACTTYCVGSNNAVCVSNCRASALAADIVSWAGVRDLRL